MFQQIAALKSSFPSAFSALGVGCVGFLGQIPLWLTMRKQYSLDDGAFAQSLPILAVPAIPYILAFTVFFYTYATGFALIAVASRLRGQSPEKDALQLANVIQIKDEILAKFYFEQRALAEIFDGLGLSIRLSGISATIALAVKTGIFSVIPWLNLVFSCLLMLSFWREAHKRIFLIECVIRELNPKVPNS